MPESWKEDGISLIVYLKMVQILSKYISVSFLEKHDFDNFDNVTVGVVNCIRLF